MASSHEGDLSIMKKPNICVLKTDGINCDEEMSYAFEVANGIPETVHINQLRSGEKRLGNYSILALPGGFSYGDDIASGQVLANELKSFLFDQLNEFKSQEKPILGVCNGFQVLVRTGLLPEGELGKQVATLSTNEIGRFECRWIDLAIGNSVCKFIQPEDFADQPLPMQIAHGEGRFVADDNIISKINTNRQVIFRYSTLDLQKPSGYPENPNGSIDDIAGICDPTGLVVGMMPHPERSIGSFHPHRVRTEVSQNAAEVIFKNIVNYVQ